MRDRLLERAKLAFDNAYAPYSKFHVGAAILADDGQIYNGSNVENVAYPQGVCAEASAISAMITAGAKHIKEVVVYADAPTPITPCGGCRQKLLEFSDADVQIHIASSRGFDMTVTMAELVPFAFDRDSLK